MGPASQEYGHGSLHLPSQGYSFSLVRAALNRNALVVFMRQGVGWRNYVSGLTAYDRVCDVKNSRNPVISPNNCEMFEEVVKAIEANVA